MCFFLIQFPQVHTDEIILLQKIPHQGSIPRSRILAVNCISIFFHPLAHALKNDTCVIPAPKIRGCPQSRHQLIHPKTPIKASINAPRVDVTFLLRKIRECPGTKYDIQDFRNQRVWTAEGSFLWQ